MVVAAKKPQELGMSIESFFLGKWVIEEDFRCIPAMHLHMPRLRSHYQKEGGRNSKTETPLVSSEKPPSAFGKSVKRTGIVYYDLTPDSQTKSKGRRMKKNTSNSEKVSRNSKTADPSVVTGKLPSESVIHCVKRTGVVLEAENLDGQIKNKDRGVKRKVGNSEIIESQAETKGTGLSRTKVRQSQKNWNKENIYTDHSVRHSERKEEREAFVCLKEISNSMIERYSKKEKSSEKTIRCKEKEPNKEGQGKTGKHSDQFIKNIEDKPEETSKYRQRWRTVKECEQEKNDKISEKENKPSEDNQSKRPSRKAKTNAKWKYLMEDSYEDDGDETWEVPREMKKKNAEKKLENNNRKRLLTEDKNEIKRASTRNKTSLEQKEMQNKKINQEPANKVTARKTKGKTGKASTKKSKKAKVADGIPTQTSSQENQKENLKPEDCVVTAKRGTLKFLKQREEVLKAKAKEAQVDDDFFSNDAGLKKKKKLLSALIVPASLDDSLTIKTPKSKGTKDVDSVITPRTALLGKFGSVTPTSHPSTPSASSPLSESKTVSRSATLEVMFHQMKGNRKRPRGFRKIHQDNHILSDSMLKKPHAPQLLELPAFLDAEEGDSSHDEYFNSSDTI